MQYSIFQRDDQLLAQQQYEGDVLDTTLLATDQQRSVLQTLKATNQRNAIAYSPYGYRPAENGLTSLLGFNGERPDPVTGHFLLGNGYRAFNPLLMRFNSPDSLSPFGEGGINTYSYCFGDPTNWSDKTGHIPSAVLSPLMEFRAFVWASKAKDKVATSFAKSIGSYTPPKTSARHSLGELLTHANTGRRPSSPAIPSLTAGKPDGISYQPEKLSDISLSSLIKSNRNLKNVPPNIPQVKTEQNALRSLAERAWESEHRLIRARGLLSEAQELIPSKFSFSNTPIIDVNAALQRRIRSLRPVRDSSGERFPR